MQDRYVADEARVSISSLEAETIMKSTPVQTVKSILGRIGIEYEDGLPKEAYISALKEEFCSEPKWVLLMLPKVMLDFLTEVWENSVIAMTEERWNYIEYLKIFGFLAYQMGNPVTDEPNRLIVVEEMKDNFYFLLKSRKNRKLLSVYDEWEKIITGFMYYYGFIETRTLYSLFLKVSKKVISYEDFLLFIKCRTSLWPFGAILKDTFEKIITGFMYYYGFIETRTLYSLFLKVSKKVISYEDFLLFIKCRTSLWPFGAILKDTFEKNEYFQYLNVENPDMLLEYVRQHENLPYKPIKLEDLMYVSDAAGIDNRWRGVSELGNLFIDKMGLNYYRATVLVRTLLIMIKNGSSYEKLQEKVSILSFENAQIREEVQQAVRQIFENVPVFEYKGYSRAEYKRLSYQKQLKKRKNLFTIIDGGKE